MKEKCSVIRPLFFSPNLFVEYPQLQQTDAAILYFTIVLFVFMHSPVTYLVVFGEFDRQQHLGLL